MQITATRLFRHGRTTFDAGHTYDVPDSLGGYFVLNGWATSPDLDPHDPAQGAEITIDPRGAVVTPDAGTAAAQEG